MEKLTPRQLILKSLKEKSSMKQDVYVNTFKAFSLMKSMAFEIVCEIKKDSAEIDSRVVVDYREKGEFEFELRIAGDLLIFAMHTNIFEFDKSHPLWRSSYIKDDHARSFCGIINIYNFLNDSFKYNRVYDLGYLVGRVFINKENHYFADGKRQLGFLYNDFVHSVIDEKAIRSLLESTILYCLNFDLFTPPFDSIKEISVSDMQTASESMQIKTGKRLGFRFQADNDEID
ncbi:MAG: hypothetical protein A3F72_01195 [Bacteroidetes bacterium RIFCSPLOWO2_12_FULL_35_15]|nr:MAG: hypothetical protein A3F72_01195 [Bacteroidetes bacterium RIFCSPLOWO2_12_FULL_35_15]